MPNRTSFRTPASRLFAGAVVLATATFGLAACAPAGSTGSSGGGDEIGVSLIVKTNSNPFFIAMQEGAEAAAADAGVSLTLAAGKEDGDEDTQIKAIEDAIARGDQGILITPNGPGVLDAIGKARDAGLYVIALDTPPDPADAVDITFATDNRLAGQLIGEWTAAQLGGEKATIAMLDLFDDKIVSVDYNRDQGFLEGMGIDVADGSTNGDEAIHRNLLRRRLRDRRQRGEQRRRGRRPGSDGDPALEEPRHQRRLHDQRACRLRRRAGAARSGQEPG